MRAYDCKLLKMQPLALVLRQPARRRQHMPKARRNTRVIGRDSHNPLFGSAPKLQFNLFLTVLRQYLSGTKRLPFSIA